MRTGKVGRRGMGRGCQYGVRMKGGGELLDRKGLARARGVTRNQVFRRRRTPVRGQRRGLE